METAIMENTGKANYKVTVTNELGMHARPAAQIAQLAGKAQSKVWLYTSTARVDATSIIDILTLGAVKDTQVIIEIENNKDAGILEQILEFFETGFGEK